MSVQCCVCRFRFPFAPYYAGRQVKCPFCNGLTWIPLLDTKDAPELSAPKSVDRRQRRIERDDPSAPVEVSLLTDLLTSNQPQLPCPSCRRLIAVASFLRADGRCDHCDECLSEGDLPAITTRVLRDEADCNVYDDFLELKRRSRQKRMEEKDAMETIARTIAEWMAAQFNASGKLIQRDAANGIAERFGGRFVYVNNNGNLAIMPGILDQFRELTQSSAVWSKSGQYWRRRTEHDAADKRLVE